MDENELDPGFLEHRDVIQERSHIDAFCTADLDDDSFVRVGHGSDGVKASKAEAGGFIEAEHQVHGLDRRARGTLAEVVDGAKQDDPPLARVEGEADLRTIGACEELRLGMSVKPRSFMHDVDERLLGGETPIGPQDLDLLETFAMAAGDRLREDDAFRPVPAPAGADRATRVLAAYGRTP